MSQDYKLISGIVIIVSIILAGAFFITNYGDSGDQQISEKNITNVQPTLSSDIYVADFGIKGDGSDETAKLQSALDYAGAHSSKAVVFPADKTIGISRTVETPPKLELIGNGCTIKLIDHSGMGYGDSLFVVGAYSYVHDLKFNGNMDNQDDTPNGVYLLTDSRFENNEVFNISAYMLGTYRGDNIIINNNIIHDTRQYGIATSGEGFPVVNDYSNNITITNNTIYNCGQVGIKIRQTSNSLVKGNIITTPKSDPDHNEPSGIRLYSFDGPNDHIIISNNTVTGGGIPFDEGISSDDAHNTNITITGNNVSNTYYGIHIKFNNGVVTDNTIFHCVQCILDKGMDNIVIPNTLIDCPLFQNPFAWGKR